jgi:hypothetical protein
MFDFSPPMDEVAMATECDDLEKLIRLQCILGDNGFPEYVLKYVKRICPHGAASIAVHRSLQINHGYSGADVDKIVRSKGFLGTNQLKGANAEAIHHFRIIRNPENKARLFYKFQGSIQFIKNLRHDA